MDFKPETIDQPIYIKSFNSNYNSELKSVGSEYSNKELIIINKGRNEKYSASLLVLFDKIIDTWQPKDVSKLTNNHILQILEHKPEIILIGTGDKLSAIDYEILEPLYIHRAAFEIMSTMSACRTYNLLAAEHRNVAAGLII